VHKSNLKTSEKTFSWDWAADYTRMDLCKYTVLSTYPNEPNLPNPCVQPVREHLLSLLKREHYKNLHHSQWNARQIFTERYHDV